MKSVWKNKMHFGEREFEGTYTFPSVKGKKERVFSLCSDKRTVSFESFQAAKKSGWKKIK